MNKKSKAKMLGYNEFYDLVKFRGDDRIFNLDGNVAAEILYNAVSGEMHDAYAEIADLKRQLARAKAVQYAARTLAGTAELMLSSGSHPGAMKDAVCSPGGSTIVGVRALEKGGFRSAVMEAVIATYEKNKQF